jgi:hypothetical protein
LIREIRAKVAEPKAIPDPFKETSILEKGRSSWSEIRLHEASLSA